MSLDIPKVTLKYFTNFYRVIKPNEVPNIH